MKEQPNIDENDNKLETKQIIINIEKKTDIKVDDKENNEKEENNIMNDIK